MKNCSLHEHEFMVLPTAIAQRSGNCATACEIPDILEENSSLVNNHEVAPDEYDRFFENAWHGGLNSMFRK